MYTIEVKIADGAMVLLLKNDPNGPIRGDREAIKKHLGDVFHTVCDNMSLKFEPRTASGD